MLGTWEKRFLAVPGKEGWSLGEMLIRQWVFWIAGLDWEAVKSWEDGDEMKCAPGARQA